MELPGGLVWGRVSYCTTVVTVRNPEVSICNVNKSKGFRVPYLQMTFHYRGSTTKDCVTSLH